MAAKRAGPSMLWLHLDIPDRDMDVPLSELGMTQARAFGEWLQAAASEDLPDTVIASPYRRAVRTAEVVAGRAGLGPVRTDERLRERDLGMMDLLTTKGFVARFPAEAAHRERLGKFYYRPPGGESWTDVALRCRSMRDSLALEHSNERILLVTHEVVKPTLLPSPEPRGPWYRWRGSWRPRTDGHGSPRGAYLASAPRVRATCRPGLVAGSAARSGDAAQAARSGGSPRHPQRRADRLPRARPAACDPSPHGADRTDKARRGPPGRFALTLACLRGRLPALSPGGLLLRRRSAPLGVATGAGLFFPPRFDASGVFAIFAARSFDMPLSFRASYCFSFLTLARARHQPPPSVQSGSFLPTARPAPIAERRPEAPTRDCNERISGRRREDAREEGPCGSD